MNDMTVLGEVWPLAADEEGIWLLSGLDPWQSALPITSDADIHAEIELLMQMHGMDLSDVPLLHSTSWRQHGPSTILTYVAIVRKPGYVRQNWPVAEPISPHLPGFVGKPYQHGAAEAPTPRFIDVVLHAIRHLALLRDTDDTAAAVFDEHWLHHIEKLRPALAGMYRIDEHRPADHRRVA